MHPRVAIIYNDPIPGRYGDMGEEKAILGVLEEVAGVEESLTERGYPITRMPLLPPLKEAKAKLKGIEADVIFNLFEGFADDPQTEPAIAHFLPELGIPYTGCPGSAISLALDKSTAKGLLEAAGIDTPAWQKLNPITLAEFRLPYPCIVKPCAEDASHGISEESVVYDFPSLKRQVTKMCQLFGGEVLVEEYIDGREFNTTVMGNTEPTVLAISEIVYTLPPGLPKVLTFAAKWDTGTIYCEGTNNVCPADISPTTRAAIADAALRAFKCLGCSGYARVDFRMDALGKITVLEVNPNPDISPDVGAARQARAAGYTYAGFIERIVQLALEQKILVDGMKNANV